MVDLAQQQFRPVPGGAHLGLGPFLVPPHRLGPQGGADRLGEQLPELALEVLPHVVGGPRLEGGDGDAAVLRAGDVDHRRRIRQGADRRQQVEAGLAGHVVVQGHEIDAAGLEPGEARRPVGGVLDGVAAVREGPLHEAGETGIVVDVEDAEAGPGRPSWSGCHGVSGICMTEKNRPSWRIALAKPS